MAEKFNLEFDEEDEGADTEIDDSDDSPSLFEQPPQASTPPYAVPPTPSPYAPPGPSGQIQGTTTYANIHGATAAMAPGRPVTAPMMASASQFPSATQWRVWKMDNGRPWGLGEIDIQCSESDFIARFLDSMPKPGTNMIFMLRPLDIMGQELGQQIPYPISGEHPGIVQAARNRQLASAGLLPPATPGAPASFPQAPPQYPPPNNDALRIAEAALKQAAEEAKALAEQRATLAKQQADMALSVIQAQGQLTQQAFQQQQEQQKVAAELERRRAQEAAASMQSNFQAATSIMGAQYSTTQQQLQAFFQQQQQAWQQQQEQERVRYERDKKEAEERRNAELARIEADRKIEAERIKALIEENKNVHQLQIAQIKAEQERQVAQAKADADFKIQMAKIEADDRARRAEAEEKRRIDDLNYQRARERAEADAAEARRQREHEAFLAQQKADAEIRQKQADGLLQLQLEQTKLQQYRNGGGLKDLLGEGLKLVKDLGLDPTTLIERIVAPPPPPNPTDWGTLLPGLAAALAPVAQEMVKNARPPVYPARRHAEEDEEEEPRFRAAPPVISPLAPPQPIAGIPVANPQALPLPPGGVPAQSMQAQAVQTQAAAVAQGQMPQAAPPGSPANGLPLAAQKAARIGFRNLVANIRKAGTDGAQWIEKIKIQWASEPAMYHFAQQFTLKAALLEAGADPAFAASVMGAFQSWPEVPSDLRYE